MAKLSYSSIEMGALSLLHPMTGTDVMNTLRPRCYCQWKSMFFILLPAFQKGCVGKNYLDR